MSFFLYDITFLIIFGIFLTIFLILNRKKVKREGILILFKTKQGIKLIDRVAKTYKKCLNSFEYIVIFVGYILMAGIIFLLLQLVYLFAKFPELVRAVKIPPIMPLIPYLPKIFNIDFLPPFYFTYWIVVLAIAAVSHEFFHGIFARARNIKIKSTGFAFLGPFTGAFVEPDERQVKKLKIKPQLAFVSAGTFANLLVAILFFIIMWGFFVSAFTPSGVVFNTYTFSAINTSQIESIGNESFIINLNGDMNLTKISYQGNTYYVNGRDVQNLKDLDYVFAYEDAPALNAGVVGAIIEVDGVKIKEHVDLKQILDSKKPGEEIIVKTFFDDTIKEYKINLGKNPRNQSQAYLGIALINTEASSFLGQIRSKLVFFKDPNTYYKPKSAENLTIFIYNLIWWIVLINFSVALVNMLPVGIFDGGRIFYLSILGLTKSEKTAKKAFALSTYIILLIFVLLTFLWFINFV